MHVVPIVAAPAYEAPGHDNMTMRRLQGMEAGPSESVWLGLSKIQPGGGTSLSASDQEKFYVLIEGEVTVTTDRSGQTLGVVLRPLDSCRIEPFEARQIHNHSASIAQLLLVMPLKKPASSK